MNSIWFFIKTTVKGGVFFFLPLFFIVMVIEKAFIVLSKVISPLAIKFGVHNFAGRASIGILILIVIILICFIGGLLTRIRQLKRLNEKLDETLTDLVPQYRILRSKTDSLRSDEVNK